MGRTKGVKHKPRENKPKKISTYLFYQDQEYLDFATPPSKSQHPRLGPWVTAPLKDLLGKPITVQDGVLNQHGYPYCYREHIMAVISYVKRLEATWKMRGAFDCYPAIDYEDLIQEGLLAAFKAWYHFNPNRGSHFEPYLQMNLKAYVKNEIVIGRIQKKAKLQSVCNARLFNRVPELLDTSHRNGHGNLSSSFCLHSARYQTHENDHENTFFSQREAFWNILARFSPQEKAIFLAYYEGRYRDENEICYVTTLGKLSKEYHLSRLVLVTMLKELTVRFQVAWDQHLKQVGQTDLRTKEDWLAPIFPIKEYSRRLWSFQAETKKQEDEVAQEIGKQYELEKNKLSINEQPKLPAFKPLAKPEQVLQKAKKRENHYA